MATIVFLPLLLILHSRALKIRRKELLLAYTYNYKNLKSQNTLPTQ